VKTPIRAPRATTLKRTWWLSLLVSAVAVAVAHGAAGASGDGAPVTASGADRAQHHAHPSKARVRARPKVVSRAVTFAVRNTNSSALPCASDGAAYEVKGHLVGPRSAVSGTAARRRRAVTLYLHGLGFGEFFWNFKQVPGYDYAAAQGRAGHVSVVIDRIGYESSGHPDGNQTCLGSQADTAHQVVQSLRSGKYGTEGGKSVRFKKVALAGHSVGGFIADIEAYSFKDVDALIIMSASYSNLPFAAIEFGQARAVCQAGGQPSEPGGPPGYAYMGQTPAAFRATFFHSARNSVIDAVTAARNRDPCGDTASVIPALLRERSVAAIKVPVLVICGTRDVLFSPLGCGLQRDRYTGARSASLALVKNAGHAVTLEREAATFRKKVSRWLARRGF
jgi:pimeloyl-ACP methyl ester carboxylesterase